MIEIEGAHGARCEESEGEMGFWGSDTEQLTVFAQSCRVSSQSIAGRLTTLESAVLGATWVGADADRTRATWSSEISPGLARLVEMLEAYGAELVSHAEEQESASRAGGGVTGGDPGGLDDGIPTMPSLALGGLLGMLGRPSAAPLSGNPFDGSLLSGLDVSSEIGMPGIAPGEPDTGRSIWDWLLGKKESPLPDLPGGDKEDPVDPVPDPGDLVPERDEKQPNPLDGPQKPANWPDDMPWPPPGQAPSEDGDGQYIYGDEGYGGRGDATDDERPVGTWVDEGGQDGGSVGTEDGGAYAEGKWVVNGGVSVTEDDNSNFTVSAGGRAGVSGSAGAGSSDGTGLGAEGSAEIYAEAGATVGNDGHGIGGRIGGQAGGSVSYAETNEDGSSSIYTVEASAGADAHASHHGHRVRNEEGETTGWATGFDVGAGASAGYSYTEERISPGGWFQTSTTTSTGVGKEVGAEANLVLSTDEVSISLGGSIPGMPNDMPSAGAVGINPNRIVSDLSGGAFDADDVVDKMGEFSPYGPRHSKYDNPLLA